VTGELVGTLLGMAEGDAMGQAEWRALLGKAEGSRLGPDEGR